MKLIVITLSILSCSKIVLRLAFSLLLILQNSKTIHRSIYVTHNMIVSGTQVFIESMPCLWTMAPKKDEFHLKTHISQ